jgi:hypothetical protein
MDSFFILQLKEAQTTATEKDEQINVLTKSLAAVLSSPQISSKLMFADQGARGQAARTAGREKECGKDCVQS